MNDIPAEYLGPKMQALADDRKRRFAFIMGCGEFSASAGAREAGYTHTEGADRVVAHRLMHNPAIVEAIKEVASVVLGGLVPLAIRAAKEVLGDSEHPHHGRMIETVLDRTGFSAKSEHTVKVEHSLDTRELEDLARRLATEAGIDPRKLLGANTAIEGEFTVVKADERPAADA